MFFTGLYVKSIRIQIIEKCAMYWYLLTDICCIYISLRPVKYI
nr:MAG TPA: hypothetical protein [Caudoviricetes sp.]